jgi:hypothetical protein
MPIKIFDSNSFIAGAVAVFSKAIFRPTELFIRCNPFALFGLSDLATFMLICENFTMAEASLFSSRENRELREESRQKPGVPQVGSSVKQFNQVEIGKDLNGQPTSNSVVRTRAYAAAPITLIVFIASILVAFSPNRDSLFLSIPEGQALPKFLSEMAQKTRNSDTTRVVIRILGCQSLPTWLEDAFKDTFFDNSFITSPTGFITFLNWCSWLKVNNGNYVAMVDYERGTSSRLFPQLQAGMQCTFTALNANPSEEGLLGSVQLLPCNAYPNSTVKDVNIFDCVGSGMRIFKDAACAVLLPFDLLDDSINYNFSSSQNFSIIVVCRISGQINNSNNFVAEAGFDPLSETSPVKLVAPSEPTGRTKPKQPKKGRSNFTPPKPSGSGASGSDFRKASFNAFLNKQTISTQKDLFQIFQIVASFFAQNPKLVYKLLNI